ncbi:hypothetical protein BXY66_0426 [Shimia isoporae]|uniref:Uncharacterized protein n=2 Tax=Shimia isoporae TaxID=647720 RepID=A0A4R1NL30_9RHOB|nr:hypothetical protein BXY66_0426 [Shimia isoporae]
MILAALIGLGLLSGAAVWSLVDDDDDSPDGREEADEPEVSDAPDILDEPEEPEIPKEPETPEEPDLGASVIENEDGSVTVELGEDETGSLVALKLASEYYVGSGSGHGTANSFSLTLYLVPEGVEFPDSRDGLPEDGSGSRFYTIDDLEEIYDMQELASWDLGQEGHNPEPWADGVGPVSMWDSRAEAVDIVTDAPISIFELEEEGDFIGAIAVSDDLDYLDDETVRVHSFDWSSDNVTDVPVGGTFVGTAADDVILVNAAQVGEITIDAGEGDDTITVGAAQNVSGGVDALGALQEDGADVIQLNLTAYQAPESPSEFQENAGVIDFQDVDDSLTIVVPDRSDGPVFLIRVEEDQEDAGNVYRSTTYFVVQGPAGSEDDVSADDLEDWYENSAVNPHGLRVMSVLDLGEATGILDAGGSVTWAQNTLNDAPDITFTAALAGEVTIAA